MAKLEHSQQEVKLAEPVHGSNIGDYLLVLQTELLSDRLCLFIKGHWFYGSISTFGKGDYTTGRDSIAGERFFHLVADREHQVCSTQEKVAEEKANPPLNCIFNRIPVNPHPGIHHQFFFLQVR
ncbi:hypothetical protein NZJ93_14030 [Desulfofundulus thermocisternus]|nr:hypothetical protein [Desulfofundulus thermocisternus]MCS5697194.1 hypothetical protein [Desulfofundulus thermocisternus]